MGTPTNNLLHHFTYMKINGFRFESDLHRNLSNPREIFRKCLPKNRRVSRRESEIGKGTRRVVDLESVLLSETL